MAYPLVVMVFAIGIVIFMLTYIVPQFVTVYESMNAPINSITQICLNISAFLKTKYKIIIGVVLGVVISFIYLYKRLKAFRIMIQRLLMHLPIVGKLMIAKELNLFARTFASLQKNNVLLTDSIDILAKITNNEIYRDLMLRTINNLIKGNKMSDTFSNHWAIPEIASFMIQTGESTGELAEMLDKVADYYQKEQRTTVGSIKTFIEPIMIVGLAVMVGFILVAILVPMFDVYSTVQ
jgi:type IV pilus assembly protein PilC